MYLKAASAIVVLAVSATAVMASKDPDVSNSYGPDQYVPGIVCMSPANLTAADTMYRAGQKDDLKAIGCGAFDKKIAARELKMLDETNRHIVLEFANGLRGWSVRHWWRPLDKETAEDRAVLMLHWSVQSQSR